MLGRHAVAVAGYGLQNKTSPKASRTLTLEADRIDRFYAHDDQVGPFARMMIDERPLRLEVDKKTLYANLKTSWRDATGDITGVRAIPQIVLAPLYHKIRIPFDVVQTEINGFNLWLRGAILAKAPQLIGGKDPIWDIFLTTANDLKHGLMTDDSVKGEALQNLLTMKCPRFIWRATLRSEAKLVLDVLIDATDIEQGQFVFRVIEYQKLLGTVLRALARVNDSIVKRIKGQAGSRVLAALLAASPGA